MDVRLPDGTVIQGVPDNITKAELVTKLKSNGMAVPADWMPAAPKPQATQSAGATLRDIPRQVGLAARYGIEGLGQVAELATEPIRQLVVNPALRKLQGGPTLSGLVTGQQPVVAASTGKAASDFADFLGLPSPQNADERVVGDATRMLAGGGGMTRGAQLGAQATTGIAKGVMSSMAANPGVQAAGAATAGLAGGSVREAGGGPMEQFAASLAGAVGGGLGAAKAIDAGRAAGRAVMPKADRIVQAEGTIEMAAQKAGIDWQAVPQNVRNGLRQEIADALATGRELDPAALRRLVSFRVTGTTPTTGMLSQNPVTITREQNLARVAANSDDPALQKLPLLQNRNMGQLLSVIDETGAARAPDAMGAGQSAVGALRSRAASEQERIGALYKAARGTDGRSLPLEGGTFTTRANQLLDEANIGSFLPQDIANKMNAIATGKFPLTVDVAEQLKTSIGQLQRGASDGNARRALGLVRQALDEAPLQNSAKAGGAQLAIAGEVMPSTQAGEESIRAFNAARSANRAWRQRVERNPALSAVVDDGIEPDQFVSRFIVGKGATAKDVASLRGELGDAATKDIRDHLALHLRNAATNNTDDITKFSNDAYRRALRDIGEDKLKVFFTAEELQKLKAVGDAAKYMQAQPAGSAVNNSNSGTLLAARGLEFLDKLAGYVPLGVGPVVKGKITQPMLQRQAMDPLNALLMGSKVPSTPARVNPLLMLASPASAQSGQDERAY